MPRVVRLLAHINETIFEKTEPFATPLKGKVLVLTPDAVGGQRVEVRGRGKKVEGRR